MAGEVHIRNPLNKLIYTNIGLPSMSIRNKEILVTGGAGFIGSNLVNTLSKENHVYALDDLQTGSVHNLDDSIGRIEFIKDKVKNINDYEINPDYIFHIGIYSSSPMYKNNPHLMANAIDDLITVLAYAKPKRVPIVYASTSSIYHGIEDTYVYYTKADIRKTENGIGFKAKLSRDEGIDKLIKYYNY